MYAISICYQSVSVSYFLSARGIANASLAAAAAGSGNGGMKGCPSCTGKGAVNCATCRGTGIDRVNGNVFERWTCTKVEVVFKTIAVYLYNFNLILIVF